MLTSSAEGSRLEEGSSKAAGLSKAASFVLACLAQLPHPLLSVLGQPVLLQPLIEVLPLHNDTLATVLTTMAMLAFAWHVLSLKLSLQIAHPRKNAIQYLTCTLLLCKAA